jgi:hypothetical protein
MEYTHHSVKEKLFALKQRTHQLFLGQLEDELGLQGISAQTHADLVKLKFENKYKR